MTIKSSCYLLEHSFQAVCMETYFFLVWVLKVYHSLHLAQALWQPGLALLAPLRPRKLDFFKTGGRGACRHRLNDCGSRGAPSASALCSMDFDFAVLLHSFWLPRGALSLDISILFVHLITVAWRRVMALPNRQGNRDVCWGAVHIPLHVYVTVAGSRAAIIGIKRRLSAVVLRACRPPRPVGIDLYVVVSLHDRLAAIRRKRLVGNFGSCRLLEVVPAPSIVVAVILAVPVALLDGRATAVKFGMYIEFATTPTVLLMEKEVVLRSTAATTTAAPRHALEPVAIPPLAAATVRCRRVVVDVQVSS